MKKRNSGFSLVEMAVVLIIFGLVLASASSILTLFVNKGGAERTRKMMEANKNALFSIAGADGYLSYDTALPNHPINAALPDLSYPNDAYGKAFSLIIDDNLRFPAEKDELDYSPVCGTKNTSTNVHICEDAACVSPASVNNVAFVIISGSVNKNIQTAEVSDIVSVYSQGAELKDDDTTDAGGSARLERYDDIVDWVTLPELRVKAGCSPLTLDFLDIAMPSVQQDEDYDFNIYAKGGVPFVDGTYSDEAEYLFALEDDDGMLGMEADDGASIEISVVDADGVTVSAPLAVDDEQAGSYLRFAGNASYVGKSAYRVKIKISDDASNEVTRTLYIKQQVN